MRGVLALSALLLLASPALAQGNGGGMVVECCIGGHCFDIIDETKDEPASEQIAQSLLAPIRYLFNDYIDERIANQDSDGDGINDRDDLCPNIPAPSGCPSSLPGDEVAVDVGEVTETRNQVTGESNADSGTIHRETAHVEPPAANIVKIDLTPVIAAIIAAAWISALLLVMVIRQCRCKNDENCRICSDN